MKLFFTKTKEKHTFTKKNLHIKFFRDTFVIQVLTSKILKKMKNTIFKSLPLLAVFTVLSFPLFAQNCNPNIPIDGGLSALLVAGAGYGLKKIRDKKNEQ